MCLSLVLLFWYFTLWPSNYIALKQQKSGVLKLLLIEISWTGYDSIKGLIQREQLQIHPQTHKYRTNNRSYMLIGNSYAIFIFLYYSCILKFFSFYFQMVDLHVYLVPPDIWREKFNNALNQNINDTVSIGFIRWASSYYLLKC